MRARDALAQARRATSSLRASPPRNAPDMSAQLDAADRALDKHGAPPALAHEREHDPIASLELIVKRLREDAGLLTSLADLVGSLEGVCATAISPGRAQARDLSAPATHSGQVREVRPEAPSRVE